MKTGGADHLTLTGDDSALYWRMGTTLFGDLLTVNTNVIEKLENFCAIRGWTFRSYQSRITLE